MKLDTLKDLYVDQLRDLYNAEDQLTSALPEMAKAASHEQLKRAFEEHLKQTQEHKKRIEGIFTSMGEKPSGETCKAMQGLIREGKELLSKKSDPDVLDAGLIAAAQRVEHYEIAGYGTVRTYAEHLGRDDDCDVLEMTLDEEKETDSLLTELAERLVNPDAAEAG